MQSRNLGDLRRKIQTKRAKVGIVGLGYVGLPLACLCAQRGFSTVGIDTDEDKIRKINAKKSYIKDVASSAVAAMVHRGKLSACSWSQVGNLDVVIICVPTPFNKNKEPDLSFVRSAGEAIAGKLKPGMLVILESSTYPGTTEEILLPLLEKGRNLKCGRDFYLAYSPERVDPGNAKYKIRDIPKVVGGVTEACTDAASAFYGTIVPKVISLSSSKAAEMSKLLENIFRNVNIALVNELAMLCDRMGIDVWEVIGAAATKPFGFMSFSPGPGVGGHCIPVDPVYLSWKAKEYDFYTNFINLAAEVNSNMPYFVVRKLMRILFHGSLGAKQWKVLILGVTFKKDVHDARNSSAVKLIQILQKEGVEVAYHDPFVKDLSHEGLPLKTIALNERSLAGFDAVVIHTDHGSYDWDWVLKHSKIIFDTRNATRNIKAQGKIFKL